MASITRIAVLGVGAGLTAAALTSPAVGDPSPPDADAPSNGALVFEAVDPTTSTVQIYRIGPGGGALKQLTQAGSPGNWNECPSWSPSGRRVFYDNADRAASTAPQILRMSAEGNNNTVISQDPQQFNACPEMSPNGKRIAFLQYGPDNFAEVGLMRKDGSDATTLLAKKNVSYFSPQFSPDGRWLSFTKVRYNKQGQEVRADIAIVNLKSGKQTNLTSNSDASYSGNGWDPNGKGLVTTKNEKKLVRLFVNGADQQLVTKVKGKFVNLSSPVFAPDRSRIAYLVCDGDCGDPSIQDIGSIWTVRKNGSNAKALFTGSASTNLPGNKLDWAVKSN